jgi:hypothetical protein
MLNEADNDLLSRPGRILKITASSSTEYPARRDRSKLKSGLRCQSGSLAIARGKRGPIILFFVAMATSVVV